MPVRLLCFLAMVDNGIWMHTSTRPQLYCALCHELDPGYGRQWFTSEGNHALLCKACVRMLWRDHTKLEEVLDYNELNKDFPAFVLKLVKKKNYS
jgi:hypothetical protein